MWTNVKAKRYKNIYICYERKPAEEPGWGIQTIITFDHIEDFKNQQIFAKFEEPEKIVN